MGLKEKIEEMGVAILFVPIDARFSFRQTADGSDPRTITMDLRVDDDEIETPDGKALHKSTWRLQLTEQQEFSDEAKKAGVVGHLHHFEAVSDIEFSNPETIFVVAALKPDKFSALLTSLQSGRLPNSLMARIKGISHSTSHGRELVWDLKKSPVPVVEELSIGLPLFMPAMHDDEDDGDRADSMRAARPVASSDITMLRKALGDEFKALKRDARNALYYLAIAAAVFWYLTHH